GGFLFVYLFLNLKTAIDVPDPLRQILDSRQAVQQFVPASLTSGFPCFCSCGFHGCTSLLGPLPHLSSFALQPAHSLLPPLRSHGAEVSPTLALRPREPLLSSYLPSFLDDLIQSHGFKFVSQPWPLP
uniref:Uncharacterized protein n=1 Tax=Phocoena sinus TaxID=42100 RepID=A0A8C9CLU5_PHOSS